MPDNERSLLMAIVSEMRICPICGKPYTFNPDVLRFGCPNCRIMESAAKKVKDGIVSKIFGKNKKDEDTDSNK